MSLYSRIPKTPWQRVWFKIRPQYATRYSDGRIKTSPSETDRFFKEYKKFNSSLNAWFEANYEPIPFILSKDQFREFKDKLNAYLESDNASKLQSCPVRNYDTKTDGADICVATIPI